MEVLGPHSHEVLRRILALKGSTDRAIRVVEKARQARDAWAYVQTVLSDPPYTEPESAPSRRSRVIDRMCEDALNQPVTGGENAS